MPEALETPTPTLYHARFTSPSRGNDSIETLTFDPKQNPPGDDYQLEWYANVAELIRNEDYDYDVQVVLFDTLAEARACAYGYAQGHGEDTALIAQMDGYAVCVTERGNEHEPDLRYVDRRGGRTEEWDNVESAIDWEDE